MNIAIPIYFFYYQLACNMTQNNDRQQQNEEESILYRMIIYALVFLSPVFHIMALLHPSYCYRGHCPQPHHCKNSQTQKNNKLRLNDAINQDIDSSNYSAAKNQNGSLIKLQKIQQLYQTPVRFVGKLKQEPIRQDQHRANVNQFSNMPFLIRNSRKSISNVGNNDSPHFSRKSLPSRNKISTQPLLNEIQKKQKLTKQILQKPTYSYNESQKNSDVLECQICQQCRIPKYLRMKHCYRCSKCVHKYDHHCVLLNICIGEFNQKYYYAFLLAHEYNTILLLKTLLIQIKQNVFLDPKTGIQNINVTYTLEALVITVFLLNLVLTTYLIFIHTKFLLNGSTTYQKQRRQRINFFKFVIKNHKKYAQLKGFSKQQIQSYHPFDYGPLENVLLILKTDSNKPVDWKLPQMDCRNVLQLKQRGQRVKKPQKLNRSNTYDGCQWGAESLSSNNVLAGQTTTKSRESYRLKSKQDEDKNQNRVFFKL